MTTPTLTAAQTRIIKLIQTRPDLDLEPSGLLTARVLIYDAADIAFQTWTTDSVMDSLACLGILPATIINHQGHTVAFWDSDEAPTISPATQTAGPVLTGPNGQDLHTRNA